MNGRLQVNISPAAAVLLLYLFHKNYGDKKKTALSRYNLHTKQNLVVAPGPRSLSGPCGQTFPKGGAWPASSPALLRAWPSLSPSGAVLSLHCMFSVPGRLSALLERFSLSTVRGSGQCCPAAPGPGSGFVLTLGRDPVYLLAVACPCPTPRVGQDRVYLLGGLAPSLCAPRRPLPPCRPPGPAWLLSTVVAVGPPGPLGPQSSLDGGQRGRPGAQEE